MAVDQSYNQTHWDHRLRQYIDATWSHKPTPFAELIAGKLAQNSRILELGAGGGQDSLFFAGQGHNVTLTDGADTVFDAVKHRARSAGVSLDCRVVDMTKPLPFNNDSFDLVYAQLAIHYFDDETTLAIMAEIKRVLKPRGLFAGMVNTIEDPEFKAVKSMADNDDGLINVNGLIKRFFSLDSFQSFLAGFEIELYDAKGSTPKDDEKNTHNLIRFMARRK